VFDSVLSKFKGRAFMFSSKNLLKAILFVVVGFVGASAQAGVDVDLDIIIGGGRHRDQYDHGRAYDRWQCVTSSRGYEFRAEGYSQGEAHRNVVDMCLRHPWGSYSECQYNAQCINTSGNDGYPYPGPGQPHGKQYTCQTFDGYRWVQASGPSIEHAQDKAMRRCLRGGGNPRQCSRHMRCSY
jgi:hypothetical protein